MHLIRNSTVLLKLKTLPPVEVATAVGVATAVVATVVATAVEEKLVTDRNSQC